MKEENPSMDFKFSVPVQIRMSDLDPFAHVNNGTQCNYMDYGRSAYMQHVSGEKIDWQTMDMVLVHLELDFKLPIMFHDHVLCETKVYKIGNKSFKMIQQLKDAQTGQIKTICKSVLVGFDRNTQTSISIPEKYRRCFAAFENI